MLFKILFEISFCTCVSDGKESLIHWWIYCDDLSTYLLRDGAYVFILHNSPWFPFVRWIYIAILSLSSRFVLPASQCLFKHSIFNSCSGTYLISLINRLLQLGVIISRVFTNTCLIIHAYIMHYLCIECLYNTTVRYFVNM